MILNRIKSMVVELFKILFLACTSPPLLHVLNIMENNGCALKIKHDAASLLLGIYSKEMKTRT
jgi:hypothetical protein